jgi:hypothetical protein
MGFTGSGENRKEAPDRFPTVVEGLIKDGRLNVLVHNCVTKKVQDSFTYEPRKV